MTNKYCFLLLFLIILNEFQCRRVVAPSEDFYKLLDVSRTADDATIRRQFKKLALQYHPDKNKDDPEKAQEHFQKISNAYDVLIDPQLRDIYNKEGDRGLNEYFQAQAKKEGEKNKEQKKEKEARVHNMFLENTEIVELKGGLDKLEMRDEPWIILLFAPNDIVCEQITPIFIKFAESVAQFVKVAVIDCKLEINQNICQKEFEVFEYPAIFGIKADLSKEYLRFDREINHKNLKNFAISLMESYVLYLNSDNYLDFVNTRLQLPKLVVFRQRPVTSPIIKALSRKFLDKLVIGEVDIHMEDELAEKFQVDTIDEKTPALILLTDPVNYKGIQYQGIWNMEQIIQFLRPCIYNNNNINQQQYPFQLTKKDVIKSHCDTNDNQLCFIMIISNQDQEKLQLLKILREQYQHDKTIKFFFIDQDHVENQCLFQDQGINGNNSIIAIRPNKAKYQVYQEGEIEIFIEEILGGKKFINSLQKSLPNCIKDQK